MLKKDLKEGMIVVFRNEKNAIVYYDYSDGFYYLFDMAEGKSYSLLSNWKYGLQSIVDSNYDIVKVYASLYRFLKDKERPVWEEINWYGVKVGTPVSVSNDGEVWEARYFIKFDEIFLTLSPSLDNVEKWKYCKPYEEEK